MTAVPASFAATCISSPVRGEIIVRAFLGDSAVCVPTWKHSGMNNEEMKLLCNIEWRFDGGRWQVLREQIFLRPLDS